MCQSVEAKTYKAISLWQPWATYIADGHKQFETRGWQPSPGQLAPGEIFMIHAAKTRKSLPMVSHLARLFPELADYAADDMPLGAILCAVELVAVHRTEDIRPSLNPLQLALGDYAPGRYAWQVRVVKRAPVPIPATGQQGIWRWMP